MSPMMPGEIRCPTCGSMTPIAPTCDHCSSALPDGVARPRGLDREELEERIRLRRSGDNPFHRGSSDWHAADAAWGGAAFVPEPSDALARRDAAPADEPTPRVDHLADPPPITSGWPSERPASPPVVPAPAAAPPAVPPAPAAHEPWPSLDAAEPRGETPHAAAAHPADRFTADDRYAPGPGDGGYGDERHHDRGYDDGRYDDGYGGYDGGAYRSGDGDPGGPRRTGTFAVLGFVILGVAALLGGAIFFAILNTGPGAAGASPTPTPLTTPSATGDETPTESAGGSPTSSAGESSGATASPTEVPSAVPANFTAQAQPCATSDMDFHGCKQDGSTISGSKVWIWVGFRNARSSDVMGVTVLDHADGSSVGDGSIELTNIGCTPDKACTGYIQMPFSQLAAGDYDIAVALNGQQVATSSFSVVP
jgi:hypothetical protein